MTISQHEPLAIRVGTEVTFSDADGQGWRVTERDCTDVPGARGPRCLVFMSATVFRACGSTRWSGASSAAALEELSWRR
jgi:hypothetical protein